MKVNDPNLPGLSSTQVGGTPAIESIGERQKKVDQTTATPDQVSLSSLSAKIRELDADSPERAARLERLSDEIQAGRYNVDAREVSKKIVNDALNEPTQDIS
jgi:flagellar biosynthesis anti-sigma factor FlgM